MADSRAFEFGTSKTREIVSSRSSRTVLYSTGGARLIARSTPAIPPSRPELKTALTEFETFLRDENIGSTGVPEAEVTYVNPIPMAVLGEQRDLGQLITAWSGEYSEPFLSMPEDARIDLRYRIPDRNHR